jgi:hypothetical protein
MPANRKSARLGGRTRPTFAADLADIATSFRSLFDRYRPELHYMRGPGPKWRAKHAPAAAAADALAGADFLTVNA